jgi:hypothetical protein
MSKAPQKTEKTAVIPTDLDGLWITCRNRARILACSLQAIAHSRADLGAPSQECLSGFAEAADELCDELETLQKAELEAARECR